MSILNIFKTEPKVNNNALVAEIHNAFYTEVDRIKEFALDKHSLETGSQELIEKGKRLRALGFVSTQEVKEAQQETNRLSELKKENLKKESLVRAIEYFSFKYPHYKFITEESVKKICSKYGLIYGDIKYYKGTVPDINLDHIEKFKIAKEDKCYSITVIRRWEFKNGSSTSFVNLETYLNTEALFTSSESTSKSICSMEIVAPSEDFDMTRMEVKDHKLSAIPDPIVLQPVFFEDYKYYLIVTAWGEESSDQLVVNEKLN